MNEYFLVSLNNNDSTNNSMLDKVIYKGIYYDIPFVFEESKAYELYEPAYILVVRSLFGFKDVLTGEIMVESKDGMIDSLSFNKARIASSNDIIKITNQYKNMSEEDKKRYKDKLLSIKDISIRKFNEQKELKNKIILEEITARDYLSALENINI